MPSHNGFLFARSAWRISLHGRSRLVRGVRAYYINVSQTVSAVQVWVDTFCIRYLCCGGFGVHLCCWGFGSVYQPQPKVTLEGPWKVHGPPRRGGRPFHILARLWCIRTNFFEIGMAYSMLRQESTGEGGLSLPYKCSPNSLCRMGLGGESLYRYLCCSSFGAYLFLAVSTNHNQK